ncbi:MAG TPA: hypothetical protein PL041_12205 [Melioribacteraceae bacterium]|nr:hypothetical protein [Melioribacteraceae bacterium]
MIYGSVKGIIKILFVLPIIILVAYVVKIFSFSDYSVIPTIQSFENIRIEEIKKDSIKIFVDAKIKNSNFFNIAIRKPKFTIKKDSIDIGTANALNTLNISGKSTLIVPLIINASLNKLLNPTAIEQDSISLKLIGDVKIITKIMDLNKHIEIPIVFDTKKIISNIISDSKTSDFINIINSRLLDINATSYKLEITFILRNPYNTNFEIIDYPAKVKINGIFAGEGNITNKITINNNFNEVEGRMIFNINNFRTATSLLNAILNRKIEYETFGYLKVLIFENEFDLPLTLNGNLL